MRLRAAVALVRRNRLSEQKLRFERVVITGCTDLFVIKFFLADGKVLVSTDIELIQLIPDCFIQLRQGEKLTITQSSKNEGGNDTSRTFYNALSFGDLTRAGTTAVL